MKPSKTQTWSVGAPCADCGTPLQGPFCHVCGQSSEDFHRSLRRLAGEVVDGLFQTDGRLWRTIPDLILRPARLTRAFVDGRRRAQIPPLRLFFFVMLAIFLAGGLTAGSGEHGVRLQGVHLELDHSHDPGSAALASAINQQLKRAETHPDKFNALLEQWSERFALLSAPIAALILGLLFFNRKTVFMFDHIIFSLHSLSANGMILVLSMGVGSLFGTAAQLAALAPVPVHLFVHLRGFYQTGVAGALIRMLLLAVGSFLAFSVLLIAWLAAGLSSLD